VSKLAWPGNLALLLGLCAFVATCIVGTAAPADALALAFAGCIGIATPLLLPQCEGGDTLARRLAWTGACAGSAGLLIAVGTDIDAGATGRLTLGVAALAFAADATIIWLARWLDAPAAAAWATALLVASFAVPLILGPLAEACAEQRWLVNGIVAASPLSHLATQIDYDYLRTPWFYRYSELGALRFEYAPPLVTTAVLLCIAAVGEGARRHHFTPERITPSCTV
jgi:hypothetical protein